MIYGIGTFNSTTYLQELMETEKTDKNNKNDPFSENSATTYASGLDTITLSAEALAKYEAMKSGEQSEDKSAEEENSAGQDVASTGDGGGGSASGGASQVEQIKKQISDIQQKIVNAQQSEMPEVTKQATINALTSQLQSLQQALNELENQAA